MTKLECSYDGVIDVTFDTESEIIYRNGVPLETSIDLAGLDISDSYLIELFLKKYLETLDWYDFNDKVRKLSDLVVMLNLCIDDFRRRNS